ncbi:MAG: L-glyceraldehyde 3-phosphate reductase [Clostridiales bacterium]|nr:L-glyceraldehyde 3-phosphate reductase [Clostridiales bacterium]
MYCANEKRYDGMIYNYCGKSGLRLPAISLGMWHNFGTNDVYSNMEEMAYTAFDLGITHFDLANNYGPVAGAAEENLGKILDKSMRVYRDELCISTKAGYDMWPGPYGDKNGSRKYLTSSLDQSLKRMKLDYVDIFYHHVFDPNTPLEETALALDNAVRQGKALYVGVSNYNSEQTKEISKIFKELKTPFIINQIEYSMLNRWIEDDGLKDTALQNGIGLIAFCPLKQGLLTDKYLVDIPDDSRVGRGSTWVGDSLTSEMITKLKSLNEIAQNRKQSLAQMALSWILRDGRITSVLIGASKPQQITDNCMAIHNNKFTDEEIKKIEKILL